MDEVKMQEVENQEQTSAPENDVDKVLNSVSDEYLNKKKKKRKITYSSILGFIFIIATIIIVMSSVRVDLKPAFIKDPSSYTIYINKEQGKRIDESDAEYDEFYKIYKNSFNVSYLTALFTGKLGDYKIEETREKFYANESAKTGISTSLSNYLGDNYIWLSYLNEQQMKSADGKVYYSIFNTNEYDLKFEDVYFTINNKNADNELTFYFGTTGAGMGYTITKITVRANTYSLYEFATKIN